MILMTPATGDGPPRVLRNDRGEQGEQDNGNDDAGHPSDQEPDAGALRARRQQHQDRGDDRYWAYRDTDSQRENLPNHLGHEISPEVDSLCTQTPPLERSASVIDNLSSQSARSNSARTSVLNHSARPAATRHPTRAPARPDS